MTPTPSLDRWRALAREAGLDPRRGLWTWEPGAGELLLQPGPALDLAASHAEALSAAGLRWRALDPARASVRRVSVTRSSLRAAPSHAAEQISQLRLGDRFTAWHEADGGAWCFGAGDDGYPGWFRSWHLVDGPAATPPDRVVVARQAPAHAAAEGDALLLDLSFGTRLAAAGALRAGRQGWLLPDGREAWTPVDALAPWAPRTGGEGDGDALRAELLRRGERLLGLPYEWGGTSSAGLDCSGFVQLLAGSLGIALPRDADLQARAGRALDPAAPASWRPGDLLFYGGSGDSGAGARVDHVGVLATGARLLHASGTSRLEALGDGGALGNRLPVVAVTLL